MSQSLKAISTLPMEPIKLRSWKTTMRSRLPWPLTWDPLTSTLETPFPSLLPAWDLTLSLMRSTLYSQEKERDWLRRTEKPTSALDLMIEVNLMDKAPTIKSLPTQDQRITSSNNRKKLTPRKQTSRLEARSLGIRSQKHPPSTLNTEMKMQPSKEKKLPLKFKSLRPIISNLETTIPSPLLTQQTNINSESNNLTSNWQPPICRNPHLSWGQLKIRCKGNK